ncbi:nuclease domain-containing protein [Pandoraea capi]|nr:nuclease domain-containing protein [Pandoraea capi]
MVRTSFKRKAKTPINPHSGAAVLKGATHKKKPKPGKDKKMLEACRGERCYLIVPGICLPTAETVVPCHSNEQRHGKGMGVKAHDKYTVPGCAACHAWLDQGRATKEVKFGTWRSAYREWEPIREAKFAT